MELYHGTNAVFDEFRNEFVSTKNSIDQYGSGFYFYSVKSKTVLHGDLRVYADVDIKNPMEYDNDFELGYDDIHSLLYLSLDLEERLWDFGDIDYDGFDNVLDSAVNAYCDYQFLDMLNAMGNDFFDGYEAILLEGFKKLTGVDCITDTERDIYVVLDKSQINITKVIHEQEDNAY